MCKLPKKMKLRNIVYVLTKYGSYVNESEDGMVAQKNAMSYRELLKYGYRPYITNKNHEQNRRQ